MRDLSYDPLTFVDGLPEDVAAGLSKRRLAYMLWMIGVPADQVQDVLHRIKYPAAQARQIETACDLWEMLPGLVDLSPSQVVKMLEDISPLVIYANCLAARDGRVCSVLNSYLIHWRHVSPKYTGYDLRSRGLAPVPAYNRILGAL